MYSPTTSNRRPAADVLASNILKKDLRPLSAAAVRHRYERLPHSLYPLRNGYALPLGVESNPVGYYGLSVHLPGFDANQLRHLWIKEEALDRRFLVLETFLFIDHEALCARAPSARREYAVRAYYALRRSGFPRPRLPAYTIHRLGLALDSQPTLVGRDNR